MSIASGSWAQRRGHWQHKFEWENGSHVSQIPDLIPLILILHTQIPTGIAIRRRGDYSEAFRRGVCNCRTTRCQRHGYRSMSLQQLLSGA